MPRILLAEDDASARGVLRSALLREGYEVLEAGDGETALRLARETLPDLILLDFSMPRLHGLDCLRTLKSGRQTRGIPIIALTGHSNMGVRAEASIAGADAFLAKPAELMDVIAAVEALVRSPPGAM